MLCGGLNDPASFRFGARTRRDLSLVERRRDPIAGDSWHKE
jgi:hypothetical protein